MEWLITVHRIISYGIGFVGGGGISTGGRSM
jgi:hypothetical protein